MQIEYRRGPEFDSPKSPPLFLLNLLLFAMRGVEASVRGIGCTDEKVEERSGGWFSVTLGTFFICLPGRHAP